MFLMSLNYFAVIESNDNGDPDLPTVVLSTYDGPSGNNSDLIVGEKITGLESNAVGLVVEKPNVTTLGIVLLNQNSFTINEKIKTEKIRDYCSCNCNYRW